MICPKCERPNADGARFCDARGASLVAEQALPLATTGPTTRFDEGQAVPTLAPPVPSPGVTTARLAPRRWRELNGGLWLIGLGLLFLTSTFWPGILVLVGISAYLEQQARGQPQYALRALLVPCGLALLFWTGHFWPYILILLGVIALLSPEIRPGSRGEVG